MEVATSTYSILLCNKPSVELGSTSSLAYHACSCHGLQRNSVYGNQRPQIHRSPCSRTRELPCLPVHKHMFMGLETLEPLVNIPQRTKPVWMLGWNYYPCFWIVGYDQARHMKHRSFWLSSQKGTFGETVQLQRKAVFQKGKQTNCGLSMVNQSMVYINGQSISININQWFMAIQVNNGQSISTNGLWMVNSWLIMVNNGSTSKNLHWAEWCVWCR